MVKITAIKNVNQIILSSILKTSKPKNAILINLIIQESSIYTIRRLT